MGRLFITVLLLSVHALAAAQGAVQRHADLLTPQFRFQHQSLSIGQAPMSDQAWQEGVQRRALQPVDGLLDQQGQLEQYDATVFYPITERGVNLGLGVNLKYLDGAFNASGEGNTYFSYQTTLPMVYASAFFNISQGFKAGLAGSHTAYERHRSYDYEASISYTWENGFGLQGGWQHQQLNLDTNSDRQDNFEIKGPYLDLRYRF